MDGSKCDRTPGCTGMFDGGYCDTCGLATADKQSATAAPDPALASATVTPTGSSQNCPDCSEPYNAAEGDFCTVCAYNFKTGEHGAPAPAPTAAKPVEVTPAPAAATTGNTATGAGASTTPGARRWTATVRVDSSHAQAPQNHPEAVFDLFDGSSEALLGRRDVDVFPDIAVSNGDPAVSRRHAKLVCAPDGTLRVRDASKFGTKLRRADGTEADLIPGVEHPQNAEDPIVINDGDSLVLGEWTIVLFNAK